MSVAAIGELNGDYFVTVSFCGMNTRTEEKLRSKAMKLPEHYEKWVDEKASASHPFPTKSEWIEQRGGTLMTYEVRSYVEEAFESGAKAMYVKLMEDMRPAIEALKEMESTLSLMWDNAPTLVSSGVIPRFFNSCGTHEAAKQALAALKEKGLVE